MKKQIVITLLLSCIVMIVIAQTATRRTPASSNINTDPSVQLAILLDASNSMDGLIDQAKARLWSIVNTLSSLRFEGKEPVVEIALYMYGNDNLKHSENYVKQITPFTTDLDLISEKLFAITTYGGTECCGAVIDHALSNLTWNMNRNSMKLIYIAGNEPYNQCGIDYVKTTANAVQHDIFINTIYCGNCDNGIRELWKDGADKGKGKYFCINSDEKARYIATPYDDQLNSYNEQLNKTYIYYGSRGQTAHANQAAQDDNAQKLSGANSAERAVSKSKSVYNNESWDLVDMHKNDPEFFKKVDKKTLPESYQKLSDEELKKEIEKNTEERNKIQKEIGELSNKRQAYIESKLAEEGVQDDFGKAVSSSILELAVKKGFSM
jgi:hypothetical protein